MPEEPKQNHRNDPAAKPPYSWRVLFIYSLFGAPVGSVLLLLGLGLIDPHPDQAFRLIPIAVLLGYLAGGIPATLTGLLAMLLRLKRNLPGIAAVTAIGALLSGMWWIVLDIFSGWAFTASGAAAAFALSACLPKPAE
ncbi:hypothetical protein H9Q10_00755 [Eikenella sp. S3360]|uniref:Uncharacterized protein n=1 Tax=Eikenella glucosivorans TaxID=2766967 RepID=A0ABS0N7E9_9NEIS|nr:hypothetical protein [Eikenella glucosivorans]MBH5328202.1 hypothetical protein [Eikenella glucosivorans]